MTAQETIINNSFISFNGSAWKQDNAPTSKTNGVIPCYSDENNEYKDALDIINTNTMSGRVHEVLSISSDYFVASVNGGSLRLYKIESGKIVIKDSYYERQGIKSLLKVGSYIYALVGIDQINVFTITNDTINYLNNIKLFGRLEDLKLFNSEYVLVSDTNKKYIYLLHYDGSDFIIDLKDTTSLSSSSILSGGTCAADNNYIYVSCLLDTYDGVVNVYSYSDGSLTLEGTSSIGIYGILLKMYTDGTYIYGNTILGTDLVAYEFSGGTFSAVGDPYDIGNTSYLSEIKQEGSNLLISRSGNGVHLVNFDGSSWSTIKSVPGFLDSVPGDTLTSAAESAAILGSSWIIAENWAGISFWDPDTTTENDRIYVNLTAGIGVYTTDSYVFFSTRDCLHVLKKSTQTVIDHIFYSGNTVHSLFYLDGYLYDMFGGKIFSFNNEKLTAIADQSAISGRGRVYKFGDYHWFCDGGAGIHVLYFNGTSVTVLASIDSGSDNLYYAAYDGNYVYAGTDDKVHAFSFNGTDTITEEGSIDTSSRAIAVTTDGTYILATISNTAVIAYTFNGSSFTEEASVSTPDFKTTRELLCYSNNCFYISASISALYGTTSLVGFTFDGTNFTVTGYNSFGGGAAFSITDYQVTDDGVIHVTTEDSGYVAYALKNSIRALNFSNSDGFQTDSLTKNSMGYYITNAKTHLSNSIDKSISFGFLHKHSSSIQYLYCIQDRYEDDYILTTIQPGDKLRIETKRGGTVKYAESTNSLTTDSLYFVSFIIDPQFKIYIQNYAASYSNQDTYNEGNYTFFRGALIGTNPIVSSASDFKGSLYNFSIFNKSLTLNEHTELYDLFIKKRNIGLKGTGNNANGFLNLFSWDAPPNNLPSSFDGIFGGMKNPYQNTPKENKDLRLGNPNGNKVDNSSGDNLTTVSKTYQMGQKGSSFCFNNRPTGPLYTDGN